MWDMLTYIVPPVSSCLVLASLLYYMSRLVLRVSRLRADRRANHQRLAETIEQAHREAIEQSRKPEAADEEGFKCRKCRRTYHYKPRWSDICFNCWLELAHKMKKVA